MLKQIWPVIFIICPRGLFLRRAVGAGTVTSDPETPPGSSWFQPTGSPSDVATPALFSLDGFDGSLVLTLCLPTGARAISSHGYDQSVELPWSRLPANWTVAGMLSVYGPTEEGRRRVTGETTFVVDRQLTKKWDAFVEYVGDFPEYGGPRHLLHFGSAWKLTANQQVDVHFGVGLSPAAVDRPIGAGYSFRFAAFRH